jgi:hypothetical protein
VPRELSPEFRPTHRGGAEIIFRNHTYQFVDLKLFALPDEAIDDREVFELLLRHRRYCDGYPERYVASPSPFHGPYVLEAITVDSYVATEPASAEVTLRAWAEEYAPLDDFLPRSTRTGPLPANPQCHKLLSAARPG